MLAAGGDFRNGRGSRPPTSVVSRSKVCRSSVLENVMVLPSGAMYAHMSPPLASLMIHWTGWMSDCRAVATSATESPTISISNVIRWLTRRTPELVCRLAGQAVELGLAAARTEEKPQDQAEQRQQNDHECPEQ